MTRAQGVASRCASRTAHAGLQPTLDCSAQVMRATPPVSVEWAEPAKVAARLADVSA